MRASRFEFEYRFWIIGLIFWIGFYLYRVDPVNSGAALLHLGAGAVNRIRPGKAILPPGPEW